MSSIRQKVSYGARAIPVFLFMCFLRVLSYISPSAGSWTKRLFFILGIYNELKRYRAFNDVTLTKINEKLIQFKQEPTLESASYLASRLNPRTCGFGDLSCSGVDLQRVLSDGIMSEAEIMVIGEELVRRVPAGLNYGKDAMMADLKRIFAQVKPVRVEVQ